MSSYIPGAAQPTDTDTLIIHPARFPDILCEFSLAKADDTLGFSASHEESERCRTALEKLLLVATCKRSAWSYIESGNYIRCPHLFLSFFSKEECLTVVERYSLRVEELK